MDAAKGSRFQLKIRELKKEKERLMEKSKLYGKYNYKKSKINNNLKSIDTKINGYQNELNKLKTQQEQRSISQSTPKANEVLNVKQIKTHPLFEAVSKSNLNTIKSLLNNEPKNIDLRNNNNDTPLIISINKYLDDMKYNRNKEIIEKDLLMINYLLENGANTNYVGNSGSALMISSSYHNYDIVKLLLEHGAKGDVQDKYGDTALTLFLKHEYTNKSQNIFELLLQYTDDLTVTNYSGNTALIIVVRNHVIEYVKLILNSGKNFGLNMANNSGETALMVAVEWMYYDIIKLLLDKGADVNIKNNHGETALIMAVSLTRDFYKITELLLGETYDANINEQDKNGDTALIKATNFNNYEVVELLLNKGATVDIKNKYGDTALIMACSKSVPDIKIIELLLNSGAYLNIKNSSIPNRVKNSIKKTIKSRNDIKNLLLERKLINNSNYKENNTTTENQQPTKNTKKSFFSKFLNRFKSKPKPT